MSHPACLTALLISAGLALAAPALVTAARAQGSGPLRQAALSAELYAKGVETGDALLILAAAQLRKSVDMQPVDPLPDGAEPAFAPLGWEAMLGEAVALTTEGDPLRDLADDIVGQSWKGVIHGPVYRIGELEAGAETRLPDLSFRGGEYAEVYAETEPGLDLNITILDAGGREVCADTDPTHVAYCGWTPAADGLFTLVIANSASRKFGFALMTN
ncbi:hypothetical protein [Pseudogemmobacter bohemicus]|uniref:hypothetical protein n=1 Tax=Pseudogemmobacter bohemicus TaxID=2250708 RepID=UPI000DD40757|nr:hypothetical protein [Pseudogemmobacter bohemicus]